MKPTDKWLIGVIVAILGAAACGTYGKLIVPSREMWLLGWAGSFSWRDVLFVGLGLCLGMAAYFMMRLDGVLKEKKPVKD